MGLNNNGPGHPLARWAAGFLGRVMGHGLFDNLYSQQWWVNAAKNIMTLVNGGFFFFPANMGCCRGHRQGWPWIGFRLGIPKPNRNILFMDIQFQYSISTHTQCYTDFYPWIMDTHNLPKLVVLVFFFFNF